VGFHRSFISNDYNKSVIEIIHPGVLYERPTYPRDIPILLTRIPSSNNFPNSMTMNFLSPSMKIAPFLSVIHSVASADALIYSLRDDDASDPQTVSEARRSKYWTEWLAAIHEELESLKAKGVYEEVQSLPPGRKAVQHKWVLHIKRDKDGVISRFKARLVAKGFTQIPGQDFSFTFAPVARWDTIRSILCIAALNDYEVRQLDVKTAYLNGPLDEEIYMKAPDGFSSSSSTYWRLHKGLYGLRQAGRQWYLTLHQAYSDLGYV
jgi:hypothetical protein